MFPIMFYLDDEPIGEVDIARRVPAIGEGITLDHAATGRPPGRYRVVDVDSGFVQSGSRGSKYRPSTVAVYLIAHDDPRRERP